MTLVSMITRCAVLALILSVTLPTKALSRVVSPVGTGADHARIVCAAAPCCRMPAGRTLGRPIVDLHGLLINRPHPCKENHMH